MSRLTRRNENEECVWVKEDDGNVTGYAYYDKGYLAMSKPADYEDLEEQGLLLELPCKVGDRVWYIDGKSTVRYLIFDYEWLGYYKAEELFATKEEAEQKLKELQNE